MICKLVAQTLLSRLYLNIEKNLIYTHTQVLATYTSRRPRFLPNICNIASDGLKCKITTNHKLCFTFKEFQTRFVTKNVIGWNLIFFFTISTIQKHCYKIWVNGVKKCLKYTQYKIGLNVYRIPRSFNIFHLLIV